MNLFRDDGDERQIRVEQMIAEFRRAQARRTTQSTVARDEAPKAPRSEPHVVPETARSRAALAPSYQRD
jgi:hypothetical protein